jgi:hypothetical protein
VNDPRKEPRPSDEEARRRQAEADRAALERLYGPRSKAARGQSGFGIALIVAGPALIALGAATDGDPALIAVGIVGLAVGIWAFVDGVVRARRAKAEEDSRGDPR